MCKWNQGLAPNLYQYSIIFRHYVVVKLFMVSKLTKYSGRLSRISKIFLRFFQFNLLFSKQLSGGTKAKLLLLSTCCRHNTQQKKFYIDKFEWFFYGACNLKIRCIRVKIVRLICGKLEQDISYDGLQMMFSSIVRIIKENVKIQQTELSVRKDPYYDWKTAFLFLCYFVFILINNAGYLMA